MSKELVVAFLIEALLMFLTIALLIFPRKRSPLTTLGQVLLCVTFCWSIVVGCLLALSGLTFTI